MIAVCAAEALLCRANDGGWPAVWPALQQDIAFGREVIVKVAEEHDQRRDAQLSRHLSEDELADLYVWVTRQFPPSEDPKLEGAHMVSSREDVGYFRDGLLRQLQARGTPAACRALERIVSELPEAPWLRWTAIEGRNIMLRQTWEPPMPQEFLKMARHPDSRLVLSGEHLLEVIIESLGRLERELQGETPAAPDLWDERGNKVFRPKDENHLSNYVARHLRRDVKERGIVINREVEIRRGEGDAKGERTDVHVDAILPGGEPDSLNQIAAIIEAKGCWNRSLLSDMKLQLRDRYLKDNPCRHGVYLVGWFVCPQWNDEQDSRRKQVTVTSKEELHASLEAQAVQLSEHAYVIQAHVLDARLR
jgi:hypothetical protein